MVGVAALGHPEVATYQWRGMFAPKGLPEERRMILEEAFHKAARVEAIERKIKKMGMVVKTSSGKEFEELIRSDYKVHGVLVKELGMIKQ